MKKILLLSTVVLLLTTIDAFSQEKALIQNRFKDNWFLQFQGGGGLTISDGHNKAKVTDFISPSAAISVGKYFSPVTGARIQVTGWESKNYREATDNTFKVNYGQASLDGLFNLSNLIAPANPNKTVNVLGIMGVGYVHGYKDRDNGVSTTNSIVPRAGVQLDFRVSDRVHLNLEGMGNLMPDNFNGIVKGNKYDGVVNVLAGVTVNLGKKRFEVVDHIDPEKLRDLQNELNSKKSTLDNAESLIANKDKQISDLKGLLAQKPEVVVEEKTIEYEETVMNAVVVFKLGKSDLLDNQEINIYNAAKFFQDHPNTDIVVTGYADNATGNPTINQKLSERRAETVAKVLIEKFGIAANRITTVASGDKVQPFQIDSWNRVVIFTAVPKKQMR